MMFLVIIVSSALICGIVILLNEKSRTKIGLSLKILAGVLVVVYVLRLVGIRTGYVDVDGNKVKADFIDQVFNLLLNDVHTNKDAASTWLNGSRSLSVVISLLRWGSIVVLTWAMLAPFFNNRRINQLISYIGVPLVILNIVFFNENVIAIQRTTELSFRYIQFAVEVIVFSSIIGCYTYKNIREKNFSNWKQTLLVLGIFGISLFALMPQTIMYNFFGNAVSLNELGINDLVSEKLNPYHLVLIALPLAVVLVIHKLLKKQDKKVINMVLLFMSLAAVIQYFYVARSVPAGLPLHLCNAAVIMILVAMLFNYRGAFYFSFFANVLGAYLAIILPNYTSNPFSLETVAFTYNHMYAVAIPILGISLKKFGRPSLKDMKAAIVVFSIYFVSTIVLNAWFTNYVSGDNIVDYFFTYGSFLTGKFRLTELKERLSFTFKIGSLSFTIFYFYQVLFYTVFVFLMFMSWLGYDMVFKSSDRHQLMKQKNYEKTQDILKLELILNGRDITSPLNLGGIDMIKITNFSKRYGKSPIKSVDNFSLEVHAGEVFGFLGHNGAGKSTTIKSLVGIQSITEGEMEICGFSIKSQPLEAKLNIGYVSDNHAVYEQLTGREYINYVADLYKVSVTDRDQRLEEYLDKFSLRHAIDNQIRSYSHGMKQKLVVISSLIHDPKVWILDEPLTGLDPTSAFEIKETMREHANRGNIVFFSSHVIEVVEKICDRIAIIGQGKLEGIYVMDDLVKDKISLEKLYMDNVAKNHPVKK